MRIFLCTSAPARVFLGPRLSRARGLRLTGLRRGRKPAPLLRGGSMKRLILLAAAATMLLSPDMALAQRGNPDRPGGGRPGGSVTQPTPGPNRPGGPSSNRPSRPPSNRPGRPTSNRPSRPRPPSVRPPSGPQFSWRGRHFNRIRGPAFRFPPGFSYRRWNTGSFLPALFLSSAFFFDDWGPAGIGRPPPGRRWVRNGPDLLLVNTRTRRIEDVIYDVFF